MIKALLSILVIIASVASIIVYSAPSWDNIKELRVEQTEVDEALEKVTDLKRAREGLQERRNQFSQQDIDRLETILPDNVNNVQLSLMIEELASQEGLTMQRIEVGEDQQETVIGGSQQGQGDRLGEIEINVSLLGRYDYFVSFLEELEKSLRLVDVQLVDFNAVTPPEKEDGSGLDFEQGYEFEISITTYWLKDIIQ